MSAASLSAFGGLWMSGRRFFRPSAATSRLSRRDHASGPIIESAARAPRMVAAPDGRSLVGRGRRIVRGTSIGRGLPVSRPHRPPLDSPAGVAPANCPRSTRDTTDVRDPDGSGSKNRTVLNGSIGSPGPEAAQRGVSKVLKIGFWTGMKRGKCSPITDRQNDLTIQCTEKLVL